MGQRALKLLLAGSWQELFQEKKRHRKLPSNHWKLNLSAETEYPGPFKILINLARRTLLPG